jgi:hypothetical protein
MSLDASKYEEIVDRKLFGPKRANGGLWTVIHGVMGAVMGGA